MLLQREANSSLNTVSAYGDDYIEINGVRYEHAVYFDPINQIQKWDVNNIQDVTKNKIYQAIGIDKKTQSPMDFLDNVTPSKPENAPEVVLIGTGSTQHFLPSTMINDILGMGIGVEVMATDAAARTYNILMAEGRKVVAALLPLKE